MHALTRKLVALATNLVFRLHGDDTLGASDGRRHLLIRVVELSYR
jgi:hypothetical protein